MPYLLVVIGAVAPVVCFQVKLRSPISFQVGKIKKANAEKQRMPIAIMQMRNLLFKIKGWIHIGIQPELLGS